MTSNDNDLITAFLAAVSDRSSREAAELVGVSASRVAQWRRGEVAPLAAATMRKLRDFVARKAAGNEPSVSPSIDEAEAQMLREISERADGDPLYFALQVEAMAALRRGRAFDRVTEALRRAEGASERRAAAMPPRESFKPVPRPSAAAPEETRKKA